MRFKFLSLFLFLFSLGNLHSQTLVTGIVSDSLNVPIPFASVYLSKTTIGNMTSKDGAYTLTIPQNGEYELVASCIGYFRSPSFERSGTEGAAPTRLQRDLKINDPSLIALV